MTTLKEAGCSTRLANALIAQGMTDIESLERLMSLPGGFDNLRRIPNLGPASAAEAQRICAGRKIVVMSHYARMQAFKEELDGLIRKVQLYELRARYQADSKKLEDSWNNVAIARGVLIGIYESEVKKNG